MDHLGIVASTAGPEFALDMRRCFPGLNPSGEEGRRYAEKKAVPLNGPTRVDLFLADRRRKAAPVEIATLAGSIFLEARE